MSDGFLAGSSPCVGPARTGAALALGCGRDGPCPLAAVAARGDPRGQRWPRVGLAFGVVSVCCGGQEEELSFEVGFFRTGSGGAFLLPSPRSEVVSNKVLQTEQN